MHIQNPTGGGAVAEPEEWSPEWIYDALMEQIEPDLMTTNVRTLDERYAGESPDDKAARYERYQLALMVMDECLEDLMMDMHFDVLELKHALTQMAKQENREEERDAIADVERQLDSTSDA